VEAANEVVSTTIVHDQQCREGSSPHQSLVQTHAISSNLEGLSISSCGEVCYLMLGRVALLIDSGLL